MESTGARLKMRDSIEFSYVPDGKPPITRDIDVMVDVAEPWADCLSSPGTNVWGILNTVWREAAGATKMAWRPGSLPKVYSPCRCIGQCMASSTRDSESDHEDEIRMWREGDGWVITDVETGVTTQGETREEALEMLDEAVALHKGEIGREPTDEELRELGIDPADNTTGEKELPDFMQ